MDADPRSPKSCAFCAAPIDARSAFLGHDWCGRGECTRRGVAREVTARRRAFRAAGRKLHPELRGAVVGLVPALLLELKPLPVERRERFADHLRGLVDQAWSAENAPVDPNARPLEPDAIDDTSSVVAAACTQCRGHCCRLGAATAFVTEVTVTRYRERHPAATAAATIRDYVERIPDASFDGSCVFHGERGCTLPRSMRADICNQSLCGGLTDLVRDVRSDRPTDAIVLAVDHERIVRHGSVRLSRTSH